MLAEGQHRVVDDEIRALPGRGGGAGQQRRDRAAQGPVEGQQVPRSVAAGQRRAQPVQVQVQRDEGHIEGLGQAAVQDGRGQNGLVPVGPQPAGERAERLDVALRSHGKQQRSHRPPCGRG